MSKLKNDELKKSLWITWEVQRRNISLAKAFKAEYFCFDYSNRNFILRYIISSFKTLFLILEKKPKIVFAQYPSIVLVFLLSLVSKFYKYKLIIDAHNAAIEQSDSSDYFIRTISRFSLRKANYVIVTNTALSKKLESIGVKSLVLMDKIPELKKSSEFKFKNIRTPIITLISTFSKDEPIKEFIEAFISLDISYTLIITGKREKARDLLGYESQNVIFSDFLKESDYDSLIKNSELLVDLTTRKNCLVCGAYEAISALTPSILSDSLALREAFPYGFLFSKNDINSYKEALKDFIKNKDKYKKEIEISEAEFNIRWNRQFKNILSKL